MTHPPAIGLVIIGIDTHKDIHVAVALNHLGVRLGQFSFPTTPTGYAQLQQWAASWGKDGVYGVEGTGSYGAALTRTLTAQGFKVIEVNRPDRAARRRAGKSDPLDAEAAARAVLAGAAQAIPKSGDDLVEMIRMLKLTKDSAVKARTQAINQLRAVLVTSAPTLRDQLRPLTLGRLITACLALDPGPLTDPQATTRYTLRLLAARHQALSNEIKQLRIHMRHLAQQAAPQLLDHYGVAEDTAAALLITAGDNPDRLHTEAAFAALCGASPIPASSGKTTRYRLNRGGDRQANSALFRIVIVRLQRHQPTRDYMNRRLAEGKTKRDVIRCLKRYIARELYQAIRQVKNPANPVTTT